MRLVTCLSAFLVCIGPMVAQPSPGKWKSISFRDGRRLEYRAHFPPGFSQTKPHPVAIVLVDGAQDRAAVWNTLAGHWFRQASKQGWVVVLPVAPKGERFFEGGERLLMPLFRNLRSGMEIEGNRFHLVGVGAGARSAFRVATRWPQEFASMTVVGDGEIEKEDLPRLPRLKPVKLQLFSPSKSGQAEGPMVRLMEELQKPGLTATWAAMKDYDNSAVWTTLLAHRKSLEKPETIETAVGAAIDAWHDAAAKADEKRYFSAFTSDGIFMGTDATERWTVEAFRTWAAPQFKRRIAWIFIPLSRNVVMSADGSVAWFDEVLGNSSYGACRGTGVMRKVGEEWKVAHYNLTVPIPNDLVNGVVSEIRTLRAALERGESVAQAVKPVTIYIVRHAEKAADPGDGDPVLTEAGKKRATNLARMIPSKDLRAVITSEFKRTRATVAEAASRAGVDIETIPAADRRGLVRRLRRLKPGASALVAGHSNTVPALLTALGVKESVTIADAEYSNLFIVTIDTARRVHLTRLNF